MCVHILKTGAWQNKTAGDLAESPPYLRWIILERVLSFIPAICTKLEQHPAESNFKTRSNLQKGHFRQRRQNILFRYCLE